jgi:nucleoid-associated protein YgaU
MRKDAKIGFAIGGVLLAVLTVYAIVVPSKHSKPSGVTFVTPSGTHTGDSASPGTTPATPDAQQPAPVATTPATPPAEPTATNDTKPSDTPTAAGNPPAASGDGVNWAKLLSGADAPTLMTSTPASGDNKGSDAPAATASRDTKTPSDDKIAAADPPVTMSAATTQPNTGSVAATSSSSSNSRQYTIKPNQTLSSIAAEVYGNQRFYVAILRANPTVNPNKLKPGMKIALPDISDVKPETPAEHQQPSPALAAESAPTPASSDSAHTYKVESGDNLYRISRKLYGSPKLADTIYELNRETIGHDKAHLRLGMVLKLPQAPSAGATASTR